MVSGILNTMAPLSWQHIRYLWNEVISGPLLSQIVAGWFADTLRAILAKSVIYMSGNTGPLWATNWPTVSIDHVPSWAFGSDWSVIVDKDAWRCGQVVRYRIIILAHSWFLTSCEFTLLSCIIMRHSWVIMLYYGNHTRGLKFLEHFRKWLEILQPAKRRAFFFFKIV